MSVLIEALSTWFESTTITTDSVPPQCQPATHEQNELGWDSFVRGYWSTQWAILQHDDYRRKHLVDNTTLGTIWAHQLLTQIWTQIGIAWNLHNEHIHRKDAKVQDTDLRGRLILRITHLQDKRSQVLAIHRDTYFMTDLANTLNNTHSLTTLQNWLQLYEPAILDSVALANDAAIKKMKFLTQHFTVLKQSSCKPKLSHKQRTHRRQDPSRWKRRKKTTLYHSGEDHHLLQSPTPDSPPYTLP
jgi:hypothetical protein